MQRFEIGGPRVWLPATGPMSTKRGEGPPPRRLSRQEAKARTRRSVLDAAAVVFARKGYAGATVEDIADAAGFSIGALYSNFANKEELFVELLGSWGSRRMAGALARIGDSDVPIARRRAALAEHLVTIADNEADLAVLEAEFWLYAMRRPDLQRSLAEQFRRNRDSLAPVLAQIARDRFGTEDGLPEDLATVMIALFQGLLQLRRTEPELVPENLYADAISWLFTGFNGSEQSS
jgi:AcrR family transcriptional regulator